MTLLAQLFGDVATIIYSAPMDGRGWEYEIETDQGQESLRRVLDQSFGKVVEADVSPEPLLPEQARASTGLRHLQLSLEEAFYLKHVDKTLALVIVDLSPLPPPPSREQCSATEEPLPPRNRERHDDESAAAPSKAWHAGHESLYSYGDDHLGSNVDEAARLSDEQAWRYCCGRRQIFPATFAVYRHFRSKGYVVHTGHKYGAHFVLYEGSPDECHSRYCVHIMSAGAGDSWGHMSTMTRLMPDIAKCLLVCGVSYDEDTLQQEGSAHASSVSPPPDPSSLAALGVAEVTALSFSRASGTEVGGNMATTGEKGRMPTSSDAGAGGGLRKTKGKSGRKERN